MQQSHDGVVGFLAVSSNSKRVYNHNNSKQINIEIDICWQRKKQQYLGVVVNCLHAIFECVARLRMSTPHTWITTNMHCLPLPTPSLLLHKAISLTFAFVGSSTFVAFVFLCSVCFYCPLTT